MKIQHLGRLTESVETASTNGDDRPIGLLFALVNNFVIFVDLQSTVTIAILVNSSRGILHLSCHQYLLRGITTYPSIAVFV